MDLSFSAEEEALAAEARAWLAAHADEWAAALGVAGGGAALATVEDGDLGAQVEAGRRWQATLAAAGWVGIDWPVEYGGRGASPVQVAVFNAEYARSGAPQLVNRVGINLVAPTLLAHGTPGQCGRWLGNIACASDLWCQLFSEPDAGSDLTSLTTRAEEADGGFVLTGQKVWTSYAQFARYGICLARSVPRSTGARGLSLLAVEMDAPGVDVRPLRQITGESEFNEVFLDGVFVPASHCIGAPGEGWKVASTTLAHERGTNFPMKEEVVHEGYLTRLAHEAVANGTLSDTEVADGLVDAWVALLVLRTHNWRTLSKLARGIAPGPESSWVKLTWSDMTQRLSETALAVTGEAAPLVGPWQRQWLWSRAASIAGGTSEVQRNVIAERICGLPR